MTNFNRHLDLISGIQGADMVFSAAPFAEFPIEEYQRRYGRLVRLMEDQEIDAMILTQEEDVRYFTGYLSILWCSKFRPYVAVLPRDTKNPACLVLPGQELRNGQHTAWVPDVLIYPDQQDPIAFIVETLKDRGLGHSVIGMELGFGHRVGMNVLQFRQLEEGLGPESQIIDGVPLIQAVRMIKSTAEIARQAQACAISQQAVREGFEALHPGMTEKELMAIISATMFRLGAEPGTHPSFFAINAGPDRYLDVNSLATNYAMKRGDLVMVDGGAVYGGFATDFIRQASLGPPTKEQHRLFDIALEANAASIAALQPGNTGADVYEAAMTIFRRQGVADYTHLNIVGHGLGMDIHELPWLGERNVVYTADVALRPGMVVSIEPVFGGVDDPDWRQGIWIQEDVVEITEAGPRILTADLSKELWIANV